MAIPVALSVAPLLVAACSSSSSDVSTVGTALDAGNDATSRDAGVVGDADAGSSIVVEDGDAGPTTPEAGPLDASALTCPGPSFDGGASLAPGVLGLYADCAVLQLGQVAFPAVGSPGVTLAIAESDAGVTVSYTYGPDAGATLAFEPTSETSATLAPTPQTVSAPIDYGCFGSNGNPGLPTPVPGLLSAASGALTYDEGSAFLSLLGVTSPLSPPPTSCGYATGQATVAIVCGRGDDAGAPGNGTFDAGAAASGVGLASGSYACDSRLAVSMVGVENSGAYSNGVLTLASAGGAITAAYTGDPQLSGTLQFVATSDTTANPASADQTLTATPSLGPGGPVSVTTASLSMDCGTLFLTFAGTLLGDGGGGGTATHGSLTCTRQ